LPVFALTLGLGLTACGDEGDDDDEGEFTEIDLSVCAPENGPFSTEIDNAYHPLPVGLQLVLEGEDEGETVRVEIDVLDETEDVAGVTTRVVTETEYEDGELIEISRNFFVQAADGTVCYYGEDVDDYEDGEVVGHDGAWRAGEGDAVPGILMPGAPEANTQFYQEQAPGIAEDMSAITEVGVSITVPAGTFDDAVHAVDWNPLEGDTFEEDGEDKYYASGIGLVVDDVVELIEYTLPE
jgi:hypothetical protein